MSRRDQAVLKSFSRAIEGARRLVADYEGMGAPFTALVTALTVAIARAVERQSGYVEAVNLFEAVAAIVRKMEPLDTGGRPIQH